MRSRGSQVLTSFDVTTRGCGDRAFEPRRVEAVALELSETFRRASVAASDGNLSAPTGDVSESFYADSISRWQWPILAIGVAVCVGGMMVYFRRRAGGV